MARARTPAPGARREQEGAAAEIEQRCRARENDGQQDLVDLRTIVRSGRTTWLVVGAVYSGAREAPGSSTGVSPALGAGATGWAKSAGVSPILALEGCG
jgi:hypothetical protein